MYGNYNERNPEDFFFKTPATNSLPVITLQWMDHKGVAGMMSEREQHQVLNYGSVGKYLWHDT